VATGRHENNCAGVVVQHAQLVARVNAFAANLLRPLEPAFLLVLRGYVSWQFLKSGWLKLQDWDSTLFLFDEEYRVPLLSPAVAAVFGTAGEIVFPALLVVGLLSRYAALGLSAVNVVAVVSYAHVLLSEGFEAALAQHCLWGVMLLVLLVFGSGRLSLDAVLARRAGLRKLQ
jgi:putative oxidoreductase